MPQLLCLESWLHLDSTMTQAQVWFPRGPKPISQQIAGSDDAELAAKRVMLGWGHCGVRPWPRYRRASQIIIPPMRTTLKATIGKMYLHRRNTGDLLSQRCTPKLLAVLTCLLPISALLPPRRSGSAVDREAWNLGNILRPCSLAISDDLRPDVLQQGHALLGSHVVSCWSPKARMEETSNSAERITRYTTEEESG